jgi:hypothetical protein
MLARSVAGSLYMYPPVCQRAPMTLTYPLGRPAVEASSEAPDGLLKPSEELGEGGGTQLPSV